MAAPASPKQQARRLIDELPDNVTWQELAYKLDVRADLEEGLADIKAGRVVEGDAVFRWIDSWGAENELDPPQLPR